jgi:hypothetical protein
MFDNGSGRNKQSWPPQEILVSDWLISKKSSPLKLLGQMDRNMVGSIIGRFFIKVAHLVLIRHLVLVIWLSSYREEDI